MKMVEHASHKLKTTCAFALKVLKDHSAMVTVVRKMSWLQWEIVLNFSDLDL